ncbi:MAG: hypothetical protein ACI8UO_001300 [Verrucomicrobiales bacterium]|jgi:hypothetical protein
MMNLNWLPALIASAWLCGVIQGDLFAQQLQLDGGNIVVLPNGDVEFVQVDNEAEPVDGVEHPLKRASRIKREELGHFMLLQIDDLDRSCDLDEKQIERLKVASKGAIERSLEVWVQEIEDNGWIDMVGQMEPEVADQWLASVGENLSQKTAAKHELWLKTVESVLTDEQKAKRNRVSAEREAFRREAAVTQALAILENELFLNPDQRKRMRLLIDEKMGKKLAKKGKAPRKAGAYTTLLPTDLVCQILNEAQTARWKDMTKRNGSMEGDGRFDIGNGGFIFGGDFNAGAILNNIIIE